MASPDGAVTYTLLNSPSLHARTLSVLRPYIYYIILCYNFCALDCGKQQRSLLSVLVSLPELLLWELFDAFSGLLNEDIA